MNIRKLDFQKDAILSLIYLIEEFSPEEKKLAVEVIQDSNEDSDYIIYVATEDKEDLIPLGFICFGPIPLTSHSFDLYWIGVEKSQRLRGLAKKLHEKMVEEIKKLGGKNIRAETSSAPRNKDARSFYEMLNYDKVSKILDFYDSNEDLVTFILEL